MRKLLFLIPVLPLIILGGFLLHDPVPPKIQTPPPQTKVVQVAPPLSVYGLWQKTNDERIARGIGALALNASLNRSAEAKCNDMKERNYWSHNDPEGREPWHFFREQGIQNSKLGENLHYGPQADAGVVKDFMDSPTHRDNVLGPYTNVGYGICDFRGTKLVVQHFYK